MPVTKPHLHSRGLHYLTFTNYNWLPLIEMTNSYDLVYKWFDHLAGNRHRVSAYVIMPNHIHVIIAFDGSRQSLNTIVGNGKRFLAYGIVQRLRDAGQADMLTTLAQGVATADRKQGKMHSVFQPSFDIKECISLRFINQKLDYIHNNPLSKKWALAADTVSYPHSSAKFYETGEQGVYPVTSFMDLID